jgi:branched-chain amino acid transport system ATP-binding protein
VLTLERLEVYRGAAHVVRHVSLGVAEGQAVGLVGRNGAGKTTTMESIMGLLPARSGAIRLAGRDITGAATHRRARLGIGYAPDDCRIFPDLTVAENLQISRWLAAEEGAGRGGGGAAEDRITAVFPEVRALLGRRGLNLSGGQKKMVAIARAMALAPRVLLLDEPFEGLAPVVVNRFVEAVQKIKAMGISILLAESNLANAARAVDHLYAIDRGEIIFAGEPRSAFDNAELMQIIRG